MHPTRDFNYVEDTCRGFIGLAECDEAIGKTINIGSNKEVSVGDLVKMITEIAGPDVIIETDEQRLRPEQSEVERLWCDNSKIKGLFGFEPQVGLCEGLTRTVEWLKQPENLRKYKANIYNV